MAADPLFLSFLLLFFPFFFCFFISMAAQPNGTHPTCPSYGLCNNISISYPFWRIQDDQTQFCGYEGFGINCSTINGTEFPIIHFDGASYYVKDIIHESKSIILFDEDVSPILLGNECPRVRHNTDLQSLPFNFSPNNFNLSFHLNCNTIPGFAREIPCLEFYFLGRRKSCVNVMSLEPQDFDWRNYECDEHVVKTVLNDSVPDDARLGREYGGVLGRGFELKWHRLVESCGKCEESNGRCGYNSIAEESMCFCSESDGRTTTDHCRTKKKGLNLTRKVIISVASAVVGILIMCLICYVRRRRRINKKRYSYGSSYMSRSIFSYPSSMTDPEKDGTYNGVQIFKYKELEKATNYFDPANELGDGGFGTVYKGKLRDGRVVAVKRLYENNYKRVEQFMNEIRILASLHHQNLVCLYGCTTHHGRELLLVYEYIPNGTVADHLHGEKSNPGSLSWTTRMSIAIETASALVYLHHSVVVHRDVKTNNILLDNSFTVKVADFGLSRLFPDNVTHVSTAPQGTPGYVDPEYHECYQLTSKSDVYSFGVVLIELISSKPAVDITRHRHEINLSNMAINKIRNDAVHELVDPNLGFETDYEVRKMIHGVAELAFQCLQNERDSRPSMDEVLEGLKGIKNGYEKQDVLEGTRDDAVLLKNPSQALSPDSVAIAWSTSTTMSTSSG